MKNSFFLFLILILGIVGCENPTEALKNQGEEEGNLLSPATQWATGEFEAFTANALRLGFVFLWDNNVHTETDQHWTNGGQIPSDPDAIARGELATEWYQEWDHSDRQGILLLYKPLGEGKLLRRWFATTTDKGNLQKAQRIFNRFKGTVLVDSLGWKGASGYTNTQRDTVQKFLGRNPARR